MSFEAQSWARKQRCGNVARKAVLMALANWADADGFVKSVRVDYLEESTELSRRSLYVRMRELEDGGALTRERGHREDGRETSAKLHLEGAFADAPSPSSPAPLPIGRSEERPSDGLSGEGGSLAENEKQGAAGCTQLSAAGCTQLSAAGCTQFDEQSAAGCTQQSAAGCTHSLLESLYNKPTTTPDCSPSSAGASADDRPAEVSEQPTSQREASGVAQDEKHSRREASGVPADEKEAVERFQELLRAYPFDSTMDVDQAERLFQALSIKDRLKAIRFAKIYASDCKRRSKTHPRDLANWLKTRAFDRIEGALDVKAQAVGLARQRVFVARGTPAWDAWQAVWRRTRGCASPCCDYHGKSGWWFDALFPPATGPPPHPEEARSAVSKEGLEAFDQVEL